MNGHGPGRFSKNSGGMVLMEKNGDHVFDGVLTNSSAVKG